MPSRLRAHRQILGRFLVALQNLPTTGTSVHEDVAYAIEHGRVPAVVVEPDDELSQEYAPAFDGNDEEMRTLGVFVTAIGNSPAERDTIMLEAEEAVIRANIGRECKFSSARYVKSGEGSKPAYAVRSRFTVEYHVEAQRPDQILRA